MENQTAAQPEQKKDRKGAFIFVITFLILSLAGNAVLYWMYDTKTKKEIQYVEKIKYVEDENREVKNDLLELKQQYADLQTNDAAMQTEIDAKRKQIDSLLVMVQKYKGNASMVKQLKEETETLRRIMQGYVRTIDSLNTLNINLVAEKKTIQGHLEKEKEKSGSLEKEIENKQQIINKAQTLTAFGISAKAVYFKRGGKKEVETSKARKCEKIKVSFSLGENKIARSGPKDFFIRIITPDGKEMAKSYEESFRFVFNKTKGYFAGKETLNYANVEMSAQTYCEGNSDFVPGKYQIEVNADGVTIGSGALTLE
jgi:flagellar basal body-associated protein FliL